MFFDNAEHFSLNRAPWTSSTDETLKNRMEPFWIKTVSTPKWFGYDYTEAPRHSYREARVHIFRADIEAKAVFLDMFSDIFLRSFNDPGRRYPNQTLEDLCFFHNNEIIAGTVSHARLLSIDPVNKALESLLQNPKRWVVSEARAVDYREYLQCDGK